MAMSLNRVQIIGNLTRDPEVRQIPGGSSVATFSVATNFTWTDQSGQKQEKAEFHNVVAWRTEIIVENMIMLDRKGESSGGAAYGAAAGAVAAGGMDAAGPAMQQADHGGLNQSAEAGSSEAPAAAAAPVNEDEVTIDDLPF